MNGRASQPITKVLAAVSAMLLPGLALAIDQGVIKGQPAPASAVTAALNEPILQAYEPMTGGLTKDSDDVRFLDVNISLKIRLDPQSIFPRVRPFFAMSTRFGFYWGSRHDSPVIGKSYNPELLFRILRTDQVIQGPSAGQFEYADFFNVGYAHQSNGQLVHTSEQYQQQLMLTPIPQFADNYIHRGWDYVEVAWKKTTSRPDLSTYLDAKYFIPYGFLQGREDQYHPWEANAQGKPRRAVDGLGATVEWPSSAAHYAVDSDRLLSRPNLTLKYLTGYSSPFEYSTERAELGFQFYSLPLALWGQHGYMSSLANYYKKVDSYGVEIRFQAF